MTTGGRPRGAALTVGSFDGIHLGHQAIVRALLRRARTAGLPAAVVTFEPHPLEVLRPGSGPSLLTDRAEKTARLAALGVDRLEVLDFTPEFARVEPDEFVREVLVGDLGCRELVVGEDHRFGHARAGGMPELRALAAELGLALEVVPRVYVDGEPASSTRTRRAVAEGDLRLAARLLGHPYAVFGPVERGAGRGAALGVPTVNLRVHPRKQMPPTGIFACRAEVGAHSYAAAVHWGPRPTFEDPVPILEAHLLGFTGDLYGEWVEILFLERLREVVRFGDAGELSQAMAEDLQRTAEIADAAVTLQMDESR